MTGQGSGGAYLPGVVSDSMGGVLAQNFTAYPARADPTDNPILTAVLASDYGETPLPAGSYQYAVAYEDLLGNRTQFYGPTDITLDGTEIVQLETPLSRPDTVLYACFARQVGATFYIVNPGVDATVPYIDFLDDAALLALDLPINSYNQTYPTATLGPTTVEGSVAAKTAVAEWDAAPQTTQPSLTASRSDTQAQIDELVAVLATKGTLVDNRTA